MAYGNLVDYSPGSQPGTYTFKLKNGGAFTAFGSEAEAFKRKLDEAKAMMPQPTAGTNPHGTTPRPQAADVAAPIPGAAPPSGTIGRANRSPEQMEAARAQATGQTTAAPAGRPRVGVTTVEEPRNEQGQTVEEARRPRFNPYMTNARGDQILLREGGDPNNPADILVQERPRAGSKGGLVLTNQTVRGGFEPSAEYLAGKQALVEQEATQLEERRQQQAENFEVDQALLQDQRVMMNDALNEETRRNQDIEAGVADAQAKRDAALKRFTGAKVDPRRMFAGGRNWMHALFAGLGTFGAGMTQRPSMTMRILEQRIADDIRTQETEIAVKRDAADNALADLTRELGSRDRAKIALAQIQNQLAQNGVAQAASRAKNAEDLASLQKLQLGLQHNQLELAENYRVASLGEVTKNMANVPGSAGSRGGIRTPTAGEVPNVKTATDAKKPGGAKGRMFADIDAAEAGVLRMRDSDAKHGHPTIVRQEGGYGASDAAQDLSAEVQALAPGLGRALEGNAPNESTMEAIRGGMMSASAAQREAAYQSYLAQLADKRRAIENAPDDITAEVRGDK